MYVALSRFFPATDTLVEAPIYDSVTVLNGVEYINDGVHNPLAKLAADEPDEKELNGIYQMYSEYYIITEQT